MSSDYRLCQEIKIPAGTKLDIEAAYTVSSAEIHPGELLSFRVLVALNIAGVTVIEQDALVTAKVLQAKRGGHWGKSGRLTWIMEDVRAIDGTQVPIQFNDPTSSTERGNTIKGTSHTGEVATKTVVLGALLAPLFPIAPLALMQGFKRGENAILPEGKRFIVFVSKDTTVRMVRQPG